jgi:hypothetical protein
MQTNLKIGLCLLHQCRFFEAGMRLDKSIKNTRYHEMWSFALRYKGFIDCETQNYEMAAWNFGRAVKISPTDYTSMAFQGFMLDLAGRESEAQNIYAKVLSESSDSALKEVVKQVQQGAKPPSTASNAGVGPGQ